MWSRGATYELGAVNVPIPLDESVDVSVFHPLRNQSKSVLAQRHSKERQDVWMPEMLPSDALSTESLQLIHSDTHGNTEQETHAKDDVHVTCDVHTDELDGYWTPFVCAPQHVGKPPAFNFHRAF